MVKKRVHLCFVTTAVFAFLQNIEVYARADRNTIVEVVDSKAIYDSVIDGGVGSKGAQTKVRVQGDVEAGGTSESGVDVNVIVSDKATVGGNAQYVINVEKPKANWFECDDSMPIYRCSTSGMHIITGKNYRLGGRRSVARFGVTNDISAKETEEGMVAITVERPGTVVSVANVNILGVSDLNSENAVSISGVSISNSGKVILSDSTIGGVERGVNVRGGAFEMHGGSIESKIGIIAVGQRREIAEQGRGEKEKRVEGASVILNNTRIKVGDGGGGLSGFANAQIKMTRGVIDAVDAGALYVDQGGSITLDDVTITSKREKLAGGEDIAVLGVRHSGGIHLKNVNVKATDVHGLRFKNSYSSLFDQHQADGNENSGIFVANFKIEESSLVVNGRSSYGLYFGASGQENTKHQKQVGDDSIILGLVQLKKTAFSVPDSIAIYCASNYGSISLSHESDISGDLLLKTDSNSTMLVLSDASSLTGGVRIGERGAAHFYLFNGSQWTLTARKRINSQNTISDFVDLYTSSISELTFKDSRIVFARPTYGYYQTLNIGNKLGYLGEDTNSAGQGKGGNGIVYSAENDARLYLNTYISGYDSAVDSQTDRLLIYGDVSGQTIINVLSIQENAVEKNRKGKSNSGVSIVQVSGKAQPDSFILNSDYITLSGLPYQYKLYAYGSSSPFGEADDSNKLIEGDGDFWDFRLESKYTRLADSGLPSDLDVRAVVPQVPTYLLLSNALFHAGLMDVSNQNKRLESMRTVSSLLSESDENLAFFMRGYGGRYRYVSNLSDFEYGYGADFGYNAVESGVLLHAKEHKFGSAFFGIMGTYGRLSLQPQNVENSQKSVFDKWSATAYVSMKHDNDFYVNGLLSYGLFKGDVSTLARGKTTSLKSNPISTSLIAGQVFTTRFAGIVFDPQVHLIYQRLLFDKANDVDGFDIEIGSPDKWVARVGGSLRQSLTKAEKEQAVSIYSKLYFTHSFSGKHFVYLKDTFKSGDLGSSLEAGLGFNVQLSKQITFHGDLTYQNKLTEVGFSGVSFSGRLYYYF